MQETDTANPSIGAQKFALNDMRLNNCAHMRNYWHLGYLMYPNFPKVIYPTELIAVINEALKWGGKYDEDVFKVSVEIWRRGEQ